MTEFGEIDIASAPEAAFLADSEQQGQGTVRQTLRDKGGSHCGEGAHARAVVAAEGGFARGFDAWPPQDGFGPGTQGDCVQVSHEQTQWSWSGPREVDDEVP